MKLFNIFKKNKSMEKIIEMDKYTNVGFFWIKGENIGLTETLKNIVEENGKNILIFESGNRIYEDILTEYMGVGPEYLNKKENKSIKNEQLNQQTNSTSKKTDSDEKTKDPIFLILQKIKKKTDIKLSCNIENFTDLNSIKTLLNMLGIDTKEESENIVNYLLTDEIKEQILNKFKEQILKELNIKDDETKN